MRSLASIDRLPDDALPLSVGVLPVDSNKESSMPMKISIQLYTLRDLTAKDFAGTVQSLAKIGYPGVELAGFGNLKSASDVKKVLDDNHLVASGAHIGIDQFENDIDKVIADYVNTIGCKNLIIPYTAARDTIAYRQLGNSMMKAAEKVTPLGCNLLYHNHDFEFLPLPEGGTGMDIIFGQTDPKLVKSELDLYWVKRGGHDPVDYLKKLGTRAMLVHLKDMNKEDPKKFATVGLGQLDFKAIGEACNKLGVQWGAVEQDDCYGHDPLEVAKIAFDHLKSIGLA